MVIYHTSCPFTIQATRRRKKADVHTSARARQSEYPMRATGASAASLDIQPDTSGETSISEYKKRLFCKCWGLANQQVFLAPNTIVFGVVLFAQQ